MGGAASIPTDKSRTLRVIGAGYSRTGTLSMALALETLLEGPVMHGGSQLLGREDAYVKLWSRIFSARKNRPLLLKLLKEATAGFVAITDAPGNCFMPELLELYPDAQVICVHRDPARWWQSWEPVTRTAGQAILNLLMAPVPGKRWYPRLVTQFLEMQGEQFGAMGPGRMEQHNAWVESVTPKERFWMMELSQGWEPLCRVLRKPVPEEPFPRANDAEAVEALAGQLMLQAGKIWAAIFLVFGISVWILSKLRL
ncbi:P-loop containing nucleoside triphosphate hydrolase protein [Lophiotrema nucula]|uniref:P-loop containing nucleoside triphosphate hydrolase protein n=1 Tax=Lophiotrema nucula TaxID=690887 RepID=A0A6A5YWW0_9PLEO|nr:P-loop containing nucleoside triphosphate hydrolase protein [Lophiotrema nucula]